MPPLSEQIEKDFYDQIQRDIRQSLIQLVSERGHGKSTGLKTIVKRIRDTDPGITFKVFDPSQSWFERSPTKYRQYVTPAKLASGMVDNVGDCTYEIGALSEPQRRIFVGMCIAQDYKHRYDLRMNNPKAFEALGWTIYVLEEANVLFNSFSMRKNDAITPGLQDFVSVGRNYKLGAFLVATAEEGEIAPSLRRRSRHIYGRVESEADLSKVRRKDKELAAYLTVIPRYTFVYLGDKKYGPVKMLDTVKCTPEDYVVLNPAPAKAVGYNWDWLVWGVIVGFTIWTIIGYIF